MVDKGKDRKVWLVTGGSQGLGTALASAALAKGHRVIATARNPEKAAADHPEIERNGGQWLQLDLDDANGEKIVADAVASWGRIDVLVNNAGWSLSGTMQDTSVDECKSQMETNLWGTLRVIRGVLPTMKAQRSGTIVNQGSIFGHTASVGVGPYSLSKFALEGLSESLRIELRDFNVDVIHLVTGFFRTRMVANAQFSAEPISQDYFTTEVGKILAIFGEVGADPECVPGDPSKMAAAVVGLVEQGGDVRDLSKPLRVPLGKDSVAVMRGKAERTRRELQAHEEMATGLEFDDFDEKKRFWPNRFPVLI